MTHAKRDRGIKGMSAADRESLQDARARWSSPDMIKLFEIWNRKAEVLRAYKHHRRNGQDPDSALFWALDDWGLI